MRGLEAQTTGLLDLRPQLDFHMAEIDPQFWRPALVEISLTVHKRGHARCRCRRLPTMRYRPAGERQVQTDISVKPASGELGNRGKVRTGHHRASGTDATRREAGEERVVDGPCEPKIVRMHDNELRIRTVTNPLRQRPRARSRHGAPDARHHIVPWPFSLIGTDCA